jgi:hypothetical protein
VDKLHQCLADVTWTHRLGDTTLPFTADSDMLIKEAGNIIANKKQMIRSSNSNLNAAARRTAHEASLDFVENATTSIAEPEKSTLEQGYHDLGAGS